MNNFFFLKIIGMPCHTCKSYWYAKAVLAVPAAMPMCTPNPDSIDEL